MVNREESIQVKLEFHAKVNLFRQFNLNSEINILYTPFTCKGLKTALTDLKSCFLFFGCAMAISGWIKALFPAQLVILLNDREEIKATASKSTDSTLCCNQSKKEILSCSVCVIKKKLLKSDDS